MSTTKTIKIRQDKLKQAFLEQLKRTPTIESSCQKVGVGRATVYRWMKKSVSFSKKIEESLCEGRQFMSDVAESQLFSLIGEKKIEAIRLFLNHNNPRYNNKLELSGTLSTKDQPLTAEQKALIREALKLTSLKYNETIKEINNTKKEND